VTARQFEIDPLPWVPRTLESVIDDEELSEAWAYVVVDEIVDGRIGLSISRWPWLDTGGRLRFDDADADESVGVSLEGFQGLLRSRRTLMVMMDEERPMDRDAAQALSERVVRIGDVFAVPRAERGEWTRESEVGEHDLVVPDRARIFDITYEAREEAKVAAAAAVAPPLDEEQASRFLGEDGSAGTEPEDDGPGSGGGGSHPPDRPKPSGVEPGGEVVPAEQVVEMSSNA
jgi:hypothetical protein